MARALLHEEDTYAGSTWTGTCLQISTRTITTHITFGWPGTTQYPTALKRAAWHKLVVGSVTRGTSTSLVFSCDSSSQLTFGPKQICSQFHTLKFAPIQCQRNAA